jgi:PAS domain S-box-containing protein
MDCSNSAEQSKHFFTDPDGFITGINKILKDRKTVTGDKLQLVDGRFFERDFIPIWNDGRYDGHLWVYQDITEKINADKKLEEQRKFYEEILDNIPSDIAVFDSNHRYLYLNPVAIKDAELRKWLVGKTDEDYVAYRNKPLSLVEGRRNIFNSVIASKKLKDWEEKLIQPDGSIRYIMRNMFPVLNKDNEVNLVIGYGLDITNIKNIQQQIVQSEKRYRDVIDNSLAIVTTHNMEGKFITVNPMVGKVYGYTDTEMVGHSLKEFIPQEDKPLFEEQYLEKIKKEKQSSGIFRVLNKDGKTIYTLYNNFLKEEEGKEPYVIAFAVDITDRIQAEKELKIAKKVTEEMVQTKQNFLANMSHEIRTPMNAIMGMSRQLQKTSLNEKQHTYLQTITSASENLLIIINDILDLSKLEAGKLALEKIGFEPKMVVGMVMQVMNHKAEEKGLQLTNSFCDARLSPILIGDPYRINQVLLNLVSNAIKFTETGSVDISCTVPYNTVTGQQVQITVKDTGIGMDPDFVNNLFQKFRQEDESVARRFGGTGLGMSITKELVDLMGGSIEVESAKGKGTVISISFNFEKGTEQDLPQKNISTANTEILTNKKILVVDDNEMNRLVAATILQEYGVMVTEAVNGEEATGLMSEQHFDLVLMDIQMPVMDGLEATSVIRNKQKSAIPVIALTANAIRGENEKCFAVGMNDYLSKPFEESQLIQIVSRWLDIKEVKKAEVEAAAVNEKADALYDLSKLMEIARGNEMFINKMLQLFIDQVPAAITEVKQALADGDLAKVKSVVHRIKPSIASLGIVCIKEDIRNIELNTTELHAAGQLVKLISKLDAVISEVVIDLEKRK